MLICFLLSIFSTVADVSVHNKTFAITSLISGGKTFYAMYYIEKMKKKKGAALAIKAGTKKNTQQKELHMTVQKVWTVIL